MEVVLDAVMRVVEGWGKRSCWRSIVMITLIL